MPIGGQAGSAPLEFTGSYNGSNHRITNLHINADEAPISYPDDIGLFAQISGTCKNTVLENVYCVGYEGNGGLAGQAKLNSVIENCQVSGRVYNEGWMGGLLIGGASGSVIKQCYATGNVYATASDCFEIGGFIGTLENTLIEDSYFTGDVEVAPVPGECAFEIGGFVGSVSDSSFRRCYATCNVYTGGSSDCFDIGGFIGAIWANTLIEDSYCTGDVEVVPVPGDDTFDIGGFIGSAWDSTTIRRCSATGSVYASGSSDCFDIGGFIGCFDDSLVEECYCSGNVEVVPAAGEDTACFDIGGFGGGAWDSSIRRCSATGSVHAAGASDCFCVAGFIGDLSGSLVEDCYCSGNVEVVPVAGEDTACFDIGGFGGGAWDSSIRRCSATGSVHAGAATECSDIGGFLSSVHSIFSDTLLEECYCTGSIQCDLSDSEYVGGFIGGATSYVESGQRVIISNCYAIGSVSGYNKIGGFLGGTESGTDSLISLTNCYSTGNVTGNTQVGGFAGAITNATITNCYYDSQTSGQSDIGKGEPRTTDDMTYPENFATTYIDWDFQNIWRSDSAGTANNGYPILTWQSCEPAFTNLDPDLRGESMWSDPVDTGTGSHYIKRSLLSVDGAQPVSFDVTYNSLLLNQGPMGKGWGHNFETHIKELPNGNIDLYWNENRVNAFINKGTGTYSSTDIATYYDTITKNEDGTYTLERKDKTVYEFDTLGRLTQIKNSSGQPINLSYNAEGRLETVTEPVS
ncbi:MAG: GLUG motif-containing protein, partial [Bacillota bacterium]